MRLDPKWPPGGSSPSVWSRTDGPVRSGVGVAARGLVTNGKVDETGPVDARSALSAESGSGSAGSFPWLATNVKDAPVYSPGASCERWEADGRDLVAMAGAGAPKTLRANSGNTCALAKRVLTTSTEVSHPMMAERADRKLVASSPVSSRCASVKLVTTASA